MINKITLVTLRQDEILQFNNDVTSLISLNNPEALKIQKPLARLKSTNEEIGTMITAESYTPLTEELNLLDMRRDVAIIGISQVVEGFTNHFDPIFRKYATLLQSNINLYGPAIARQSLPVETASLTNLTNDWKTKPALKEAITAFNLDGWLSELIEANIAFNKKYIERAEKTGNASDSSVKPKRNEAAKIWMELRDLIESRYKITLDDEGDTAPYLKLINSLNAIIEKYNQLIAVRTKDKPSAPIS